MARSHIRLMAGQIALGAVGLLAMFAGVWLFWYFAIRPRHPSSYSLFDIAILPVALLVIGMLCLLAVVRELPGTRLSCIPVGQAGLRAGVHRGPTDGPHVHCGVIKLLALRAQEADSRETCASLAPATSGHAGVYLQALPDRGVQHESTAAVAPSS